MSAASPGTSDGAKKDGAAAGGADENGNGKNEKGDKVREGAKCGPHVRYGISDPISLQEPVEADQELTARMMCELEAVFPAESKEGMARRDSVLREIERLVADWVTIQGLESGMSQEDAHHALHNLKITTLGSFRLGVVHPGSDIDTLCIGPPHIKRDDFFTTFVEKLDSHEHVTECLPIPEAYTPIIKLKMRGVCIDLLFAQLVRPLSVEENLEDTVRRDDVLRDMDERCVRCVNGFRVADQILSLVPNRETFRQTLRFVKYWARQRGIYSNVLGFFGGITWSLLVARVCQLYPYYAPSQLVGRFFRIFHNWNWTKPVMLCEVQEPSNIPGMSSFKVWNPKTNLADRQHVMPVITPAFPAMNSTHNVTETTKRIMLEEFRRGFEVVTNVEMQKADWSDVHAPFPFFTTFHHFLWIEILAKSEEVLLKFSGWVESKLRILVMALEVVSGMMIHPNPTQYELCGTDKEWPSGCGMFIALLFGKDQGAYPGLTVDLRPAVTQFVDVIDQWSEKDALAGQFRMRLKRIRSDQLPEYATAPDAVKKRQREDAPQNNKGKEAKRRRPATGS